MVHLNRCIKPTRTERPTALHRCSVRRWLFRRKGWSTVPLEDANSQSLPGIQTGDVQAIPPINTNALASYIPNAPCRLACSDEFGYWFSGFFDGEGSFIADSKRQLRIQLSIRDDSGPVIDFIQANLRCGRIYLHHAKDTYKNTNRKQARMYRLTPLNDLAEIVVPFFETYPLRTKKAQEFPIWKLLVLRCFSGT